jgi:iron complex outermembrane recepter protein
MRAARMPARGSHAALPRRRLAGAAILLLALAPLQTAAGQATYVTEREIFAQVPLVVTASRLQQTPDKAPASITVLDRAMIEASTAIDIPDLLRLVPGMQVTQANGHIYSVMYHGGETAWSRRMQVLVDGRSVYNPLFSLVFWNHLDLDIDDIERIEVIRGPNAPVYGSNAFRGTINIITRQPFRDSGVSTRATAGSLETRELMARGADGSGNFEYRLTFRHRADEGFEGINDSRALDMVSFRGVYDPSAKDSIDLQWGLTDGSVGAWGRNPVTSPSRDIDTRSAHAFLRWRHVFNQRNEAHLQLYHNYLDWHDLYEAGPISALFADRGFPVTPEQVPLLLFGKPDQSFLISFYHGRGTRSDIEWQQTLLFSDSWRMVWGAGMRRDTFESAQVLDHDDRIEDDTLRLFGNLEWQPRWRWGFNAGLMVEDNDISGVHLSPRLAGNYSVRPGHTLRAVATRAVRTPSLYEANEFNVVRFADGDVFMALYVSDPDLEHETVNAYELGYRGLYAGGRVDVDIKAFHERLRNLINHARDPTYPDTLSAFLIGMGSSGGDIGSFILINGGHADVSGAELQLRFMPDPRTLLSLQYGYVTIDGELIAGITGFNDGAIEPTRIERTIERNTPRHTASALLSRGFSRDWQASVAWFHLSDIDWAGDGQFIRGYNRWDARLGKGFSPGGVRGSLALIVQNLADREYSEFRRENVFDRRTYLQMKLRH